MDQVATGTAQVDASVYYRLSRELGATTLIGGFPEVDGADAPDAAAGGFTIWRSGDEIPLVLLRRPPETSREDLLVSLHELGHLVQHRRVDGKGLRAEVRTPLLQQEAEAWKWAIAHFPYPMEPSDWAAIAWRLQSYAEDRRLKRTPTFERLLEQAERNAQ